MIKTFRWPPFVLNIKHLKLKDMTRKQEIEEMAKTTASHITSDKDMQVAFADALRRGAEWADRTMIDRVYDWLDFYLATAVVEWDEELTKQSFLDELKQKMKGE